MPVTLVGDLHGAVLHDADANPIASVLVAGKRRLCVDAVISVTPPPPGGTITSQADTVVGVGATVALPAIPAGTVRMTVQVTVGSSLSRVRIRETTGPAGSGIALTELGSRVYGGADGALDAMEAENTAGPAAAVAVQFED